MPDFDLVELMDGLSGTERYASIPIVFMGSIAQRNDLAFKYSYNTESYITKPYRRRNVIEALARIDGKDELLKEMGVVFSEEYQMDASDAVASAALQEATADLTSSEGGTKSKKGRRLLVVEDNKVNQQVANGHSEYHRDRA